MFCSTTEKLRKQITVSMLEQGLACLGAQPTIKTFPPTTGGGNVIGMCNYSAAREPEMFRWKRALSPKQFTHWFGSWEGASWETNIKNMVAEDWERYLQCCGLESSRRPFLSAIFPATLISSLLYLESKKSRKASKVAMALYESHCITSLHPFL